VSTPRSVHFCRSSWCFWIGRFHANINLNLLGSLIVAFSHSALHASTTTNVNLWPRQNHRRWPARPQLGTRHPGDEIGEYLLLWRQLQHIQLSDQAEALIWKWSSDGLYSAKSCCKATLHGSTYRSAWMMIWKTWAPQCVKFFHWLANLDRCWTAAHLQ
jgi:hypothetical protein